MKLFVSLIAILLLLQNAHAQITANVLNRVYRFRAGTAKGASFTLDVNGSTYLVSARHLLRDMQPEDKPAILTKSGWEPVIVEPIFPKDKNVDIVAYKLSDTINANLPLEPLLGKISISQSVYFVGFPHGLASIAHLGGKLVEIPFVKAGILSAIVAFNSNAVIMFIDGHNNKGFSGGPVVFKPSNEERFRVVGVVRGYQPEDLPVFDNKKLVDKVVAQGNSGIVISYSIGNILDAINK